MGTLDKRIKIIRQQIQDAKRTGDKEYQQELEQSLRDLEHQKEGEEVGDKLKKEGKIESTADRILRAGNDTR